MSNRETFPGEAALHRALVPILGKREQGLVMGVIREWLAGQPPFVNDEQAFALNFLLDAVGEDYPNCESVLRELGK
jgi:hypothetical protein